MAIRKEHAFWFPVRKFDDEIGLWKNFRYIEDFMRQINKGDQYGPTTIIAPSDSSNTDKADIVLDGENDDIQLEEAMTDEGWIHLLDGTVTIGSRIDLDGRTVRITGSNQRNTIIKAATGFSGVTMFSGAAFGGRIEMMDLTLDGNAAVSNLWNSGQANQTAIYCERVRFQGATGTTVEIHRSATDDVWFMGCEWLTAANNNIAFGRESGGNIHGCRFAGHLLLGGNGGIYVIGNKIDGNIDDSVSVASPHVYIIGNYVVGNVTINDSESFGTIVGNRINGALTTGGVIAVGHNVVGGVVQHGGFDATGHDAHDHTTAVGSAVLGDLGDVGVATPTNRHAVLGDGDSWESRAIVEADISDLGAYITDVTGSPLDELSDVTAHTPTKGHLLVADGDSWEVLAVGTDGQVLHADSTQLTGLVWDTDDEGAGGGGAAAFSEFLLIGA